MGTICSSAKNFGLDRFRAIRPVCSSSSDDMIYKKNEDTGSAFCDDTHQNLMVSKKNAMLLVPEHRRHKLHTVALDTPTLVGV
jgi:hypothetical protein